MSKIKIIHKAACLNKQITHLSSRICNKVETTKAVKTYIQALKEYQISVNLQAFLTTDKYSIKMQLMTR